MYANTRVHITTMKKVHVKFTPSVPSAPPTALPRSPSMLHRTPSPSLTTSLSSSAARVIPVDGAIAPQQQQQPFSTQQQYPRGAAGGSGMTSKMNLPLVVIMAISAILGILVLVLLRRTRRVERDVAVLQRRTTHMVTGEEIDQAVSYYLQNNMKNVVEQCNAELQPIYADPVATLQSDHASLNGNVQSLVKEVQKLTGQLTDLQKVLSSERIQHQQQIQQFQQRLEETSKLLTQERDRYIQDVLVLQRSVQNLQQQYNTLVMSQQQQHHQQLSSPSIVTPAQRQHQQSPVRHHQESTHSQNGETKADIVAPNGNPPLSAPVNQHREQLSGATTTRGFVEASDAKHVANHTKGVVGKRLLADTNTSLSSSEDEMDNNREDEVSTTPMKDNEDDDDDDNNNISTFPLFSDSEEDGDDNDDWDKSHDINTFTIQDSDDENSADETNNVIVNTNESLPRGSVVPHDLASMLMSMVSNTQQQRIGIDSAIVGGIMTGPELMFLPQVIGGRLFGNPNDDIHNNANTNSSSTRAVQIEELSSSDEQSSDDDAEIADNDDNHQDFEQDDTVVVTKSTDIIQGTISTVNSVVNDDDMDVERTIAAAAVNPPQQSSPSNGVNTGTQSKNSTIAASEQEEENVHSIPQEIADVEEDALHSSPLPAMITSIDSTVINTNNDNATVARTECHEDQCPIPPKHSSGSSTDATPPQQPTEFEKVEQQRPTQQPSSSSLANRPRRSTAGNYSKQKSQK